MIKPVFYTVFLFLLPTHLIRSQQNLIPNPSFEEYIQCPEEREYSGNGQFTRCRDWWYPTTPSIGSPDYYNVCNNFIGGANQGVVGVPNNERGHQFPFHGEAMVGLAAISLFEESKEYEVYEPIICKLNEKLRACTEYKFSCYVNLANFSNHSINKLGIYCSKEELLFSNYEDIYSIEPVWFSENFYSDTLGWQLLEGNFIAEGGENYFYFGYFFPQEETIWVPSDTVNNNYPFLFAYYFIDSLNLMEVSKDHNCLPELSNVFTPNGDQVNDYFSIEGTDIQELIILNRWGNVIARLNQDSPFWDGTNRGNECSEGTYFYRFRFYENEKTGFIQLIR